MNITIKSKPIGISMSTSISINIGLNIFLFPIKLRPFKFNPYLILIVLLVPNFFSALSISPSSIQICLIYA